MVMRKHFVQNFVPCQTAVIVGRPVFHFFGKFIETIISHEDMEMFGMVYGANFMIAELDVFWSG